MLKLVAALLTWLITMSMSQAELHCNKVPAREWQPEAGTNIIWTRNNATILTHAPRGELDMYIFQDPSRETGKAYLIIYTQKGTIVSVMSGPALKGVSFALEDLTRDGKPDIIQFWSEEGDEKLLEAYSFINGIIEPLPDSLMDERQSTFYYDDAKLVEYLKQKQAASVPKPTAD